MKLSDLTPGDRVVDSDGDRYRLIAHRVTVGDGYTIPAEVLTALGVDVALGKGGALGRVSLRGRSYSRTGSLFLSDPWDNDRSWTLLDVWTTGHDLAPERDYLDRWDHDNAIDVSWRCKETNSRQVVVDTSVSPHRGDRVDRITSLSGGALIAERATGETRLRRPAVDLPWLGPAGTSSVIVVEVAGVRYQVAGRFVLADPLGRHAESARRHRLEAATEGHRETVRDALRALARTVDASPEAVRVGTDTVTVPHAVLEALILGDERASAATLDGIAILRDITRDHQEPAPR